MTTYERLHRIVSPKLVSYRDDLEKHDKATIEKNGDSPFIYGYRPTGTSILPLHKPLTYWFGEQMKYKPIFGEVKFLKDVDEACEVLMGELVWVVPGADNKWFLYFDGKEFHEVSREKIYAIWKAYVYSLKMSAPFKMEKSLLIAV
jgi:hypothetical protein